MKLVELMSENVSRFPAPDVGTTVIYQDRKYRVDGWLRAIKIEEKMPDPNMNDFGSWIGTLTIGTKVGDKTFINTFRKNATHLSLYGISGAIARVEDVRIDGKVSWSEDTIQQHRDMANRRADEDEDALRAIDGNWYTSEA